MDISDVIKGLQLCLYDPDPGMPPKDDVSCDICPYHEENGMEYCYYRDLQGDAIKLLKEYRDILNGKKEVCVWGAVVRTIPPKL